MPLQKDYLAPPLGELSAEPTERGNQGSNPLRKR